MNNLPLEVVVKILNFLKPKDAWSFMKCSQRTFYLKKQYNKTMMTVGVNVDETMPIFKKMKIKNILKILNI